MAIGTVVTKDASYTHDGTMEGGCAVGKYDKYLHMERPFDPAYPPMSMNNRAAQFAPFAALTGYDGLIDETGRFVDGKIELTDEDKYLISDRIQLLKESLDTEVVTITYFVPDRRKAGGAYETVTGSVHRVEEYERVLVMNLTIDGTPVEPNDKRLKRLTIPFDDILSIGGEMYAMLDREF